MNASLNIDCDINKALTFVVKQLHIKNLPVICFKDIVTTSSGGLICDGLYNHKENTIYIDSSLPKNRKIEVLFHEMVHAHQYETGKLSLEGDINFWKGKPMIFKNYTDYCINNPCELDAYSVQKKLYNRYVKKYG